MPCPKCNADHKRSKTGLCPKCYMATYRLTEVGRANTRKADKKHFKSSKKRQRNTKDAGFRYRIKTGYYNPVELHQLRAANKRLESALAKANNPSRVGEPSHRRLDQSIKRRDKYGQG